MRSAFRSSLATRSRLLILSVFLLAAALAGCGGGGDIGVPSAGVPDTGMGGDTPNSALPPQTGVSGFTVEADRQQTAPGGTSVVLTASGGSASAGAVQWSLAPTSPGSLSQISGNRVEYIPPSAGTAITNNIVTIVASNGDAANKVVIVLAGGANNNTGTPGAIPNAPPVDGTSAPAPGVYLIAGNDFGPGMANGAGTAARFDTPSGIARDAQGNLYVADRFNNAVRKIDPQGNVTTFAGMPGERGHVDAQGANARFSMISGIAVDNAGNVYVDDYGNAALRKITPVGQVSTIAINPVLSDAGDGQDSSLPYWGNPKALAVDAAGNIYLAEHYAVRKVTPGGVVTTIAGPSTSANFVGLTGIALDAAGNIYVLDAGWTMPDKTSPSPPFSRITSKILKIARSGAISVLAGTEGIRSTSSTDDGLGFADGTGQAARFAFPQGLTIDSAGNLFVADSGNQAIRKVTQDGVVTTVAGMPGQDASTDGPVANARFTYPSAIAVSADGVLFITDSVDHTVRRIVLGGEVSTVAGAAPRTGSADGAGAAALFDRPQGLTRDNTGTLYVADTGNSTIRRIVGNQVFTFAGSAGQTGAVNGAGTAARFNRPLAVAADALGNLFVADHSNYLIRRITPAAVVSTYAGVAGQEGYVNGPASTARFFGPTGIAVDASDTVYVADRDSNSIRKITSAGMVSTLIGNPESFYSGTGRELVFPMDAAVDKAGNVYTIDSITAIRRIAPDGTMMTIAGGIFQPDVRNGTGAAARFQAPQGLTVDDDGNVYVADARAIRKITPQGVVTTVAGGQSDQLRSLYRPSRLVMTGPKSLAFTSGNGVFELRLP